MTKKLQIVILGMLLSICGSMKAQTATTLHDQNCLAEAIYREAGGEKLIGQYAVGEVIMNRIRAGIATSACSVVRQHSGKHWQFGFNATGKKAIPKSRKDYFIDVAEKILTGTDNFTLPENVLYFNNKPFKSDKYRLYRVIGHQRFYTLRDSSELGALMNVPLYGSHEVLLHQNEMGKQEGLTPIKNDKELKELVESGALVPIPTSKYLAVSKSLPKNRRYCRVWSAQFLTDISQAYYNQFGRPLIVDSAVRTQQVQKHLIRINRNAAAVTGDAASPHLMGIAIDINKRNFSSAELSWMRNYLTLDGIKGNLDVEEEFSQKCFHVSIYKYYTNILN